MANSFKKLGNRIQDGVSKFANDFLGTPSDHYAPVVSDLFAECDFLEAWTTECRINRDTKHLTLLTEVCKMLQECVIPTVLEDAGLLVEHY